MINNDTETSLEIYDEEPLPSADNLRIRFVSDGSYGFTYRAITLPANFPAHPPETSLSFLIASDFGYTEVIFGDVIYGFKNGRLVIACEVLEMMTPPDLQVCIEANNRRYQITAVRTRVMPVNIDALYDQQNTDDWYAEVLQETVKALHESQEPSQSISGAAWDFDLGVGNDLLLEISKE